MGKTFNPKMAVKESEWIRDRRSAAGYSDDTDVSKTIGLSLSGGGIRSATFNLGILQAMESTDALKKVDYLSTVSGGGYIGSSLTWLMSIMGKFPFGKKRTDYNATSAKIVDWLRNHGKYMTPGGGLNIWSMIAAILAGIFVNLLVLVPVIAVIIFWLSDKIEFLNPILLKLSSQPTMFTLLLLIGIALACLYLFLVVFMALTSRFDAFRAFLFQRFMKAIAGRLLMVSLLFIVIGTTPMVYEVIDRCWPMWKAQIISSISISGIISMLCGLIKKKEGNETKGIRSVLLSLGLALLIYGFVLLLYHCVNLDFVTSYECFWPFLIVSFIIACVADINHVSMHRFYRNRLMEAYFPYKVLHKEFPEVDSKKADLFLLKDIPRTAAPYHIVCTNIQTIGSKNSKLAERGGDSFIFSPLYSGSDATGFAPTDTYAGGNINLATAFAISGAAVDPNTYATRSRPLAFIMALLNIRLGYWIANPCQSRWFLNSLGLKPLWYYYMFAEMFGKDLNEKQFSVHLSDGGHFENLGLYEMVRRKCSLIIISDAAADLDYTFGDLGSAIERVRVDFGVKTDLDISQIKPDPDTKISTKPYALGGITYADNTTAKIIYIKTALIEGLPEDIYAYQRKNNSFPDQTTTDQFFDEQQFEAYRELGFRIGQLVFNAVKIDTY